MPVKNGGRTIAVLYGYTELLTTFAGRVRTTAYDGKAQISVADAEDGYSISAGTSEASAHGIDAMIALAEQRMYEDKRRHYEEKQHEPKIRNRNRLLEAVLTEKRDRDAFAAVVADHFLGAFAVDAETGRARSLCMSSSPERLAFEGGCFADRVSAYAASEVDPASAASVRRLLYVRMLRNALSLDPRTEANLRTRRGAMIRLRIISSVRENRREEFFWLFERSGGFSV